MWTLSFHARRLPTMFNVDSSQCSRRSQIATAEHLKALLSTMKAVSVTRIESLSIHQRLDVCVSFSYPLTPHIISSSFSLAHRPLAHEDEELNKDKVQHRYRTSHARRSCMCCKPSCIDRIIHHPSLHHPARRLQEILFTSSWTAAWIRIVSYTVPLRLGFISILIGL